MWEPKISRNPYPWKILKSKTRSLYISYSLTLIITSLGFLRYEELLKPEKDLNDPKQTYNGGGNILL